jgi:hypothetical protein
MILPVLTWMSSGKGTTGLKSAVGTKSSALSFSAPPGLVVDVESAGVIADADGVEAEPNTSDGVPKP